MSRHRVLTSAFRDERQDTVWEEPCASLTKLMGCVKGVFIEYMALLANRGHKMLDGMCIKMIILTLLWSIKLN